MTINCGICGEMIEVGIALAEGQHVRCPFCNGKFSYHKPASSLLGDELRRGDTKDSTPHQKKKKSRTSKCTNVNIYDVARAVAMVAILVVVLVVLVQQYFKDEEFAGSIADSEAVEMPTADLQPNDTTVNSHGEGIPDANGGSQLTGGSVDEPPPDVDTAAAEKNETLKLLLAYHRQEDMF